MNLSLLCHTAEEINQKYNSEKPGRYKLFEVLTGAAACLLFLMKFWNIARTVIKIFRQKSVRAHTG
jgi:hypothetical protein